MASSSKKVVYAALAGNMLIALTKFVAAFLTGSSAMLSEAFHSCVDTGNQILLLWGMRAAKKPPNEKFPFGRGKEIYFWSFVVAILIFAVGAGLSIYEGVSHIVHTDEAIGDPTVNYIVLGLAVIFEGTSWLFALREFRKHKGKLGYFEAVKRGKDPSMFLVLFEDSAAGLGLVVAFVGISLTQWTRNPVYDGIASVLIGAILGVVAIWLAYETKGLLIGEAAEPEVVEGIRRLTTRAPEVNRVNELLTMHMGPNTVIVNISVDFADECTATQIEDVVRNIDRRIREQYPTVKRVFIEAEPWTRERSATGEIPRVSKQEAPPDEPDTQPDHPEAGTTP